MKKRRAITAIALVALLVAAAFLIRPKRYSGHSIEEWLLLTRTNMAGPGVDGLRSIPKRDVIPVIRDWLVTIDSPFKLRLQDVIQKQTLVRFHFLPASDKRAAALGAAYILGPDARPLVKELSAALKSGRPSEQFDAAFALCAMGADGARVLSERFPKENRQALIAKVAAQDLAASPAFAKAVQNWSSQSGADIARLLSIFHQKCLRATLSSHMDASRGIGIRRPLSNPPPSLPPDFVQPRYPWREPGTRQK